ncbi:Nif3-like dinuclear metal center hexameric protein [Halegenticoccus soli]|uniref:Nif3-like dinuclear metal center hexameric protein n=1 Tax=Halegenticoccus soli TaxID=1985678 RepID=UPI000C6E9344|nr:Nif3-like dinuclear metal center hexameric protein [Halegenticoccus soli]
MKASEIRTYLRSLDDGWVDWDDTVDTFKTGDPHADVEGIAVGWMSYMWALERAVELGCNVFIIHEGTYYDHDEEPIPGNHPPSVVELIDAKQRFIEEHGLVILRCHDLWDQYPEIGVPDAWGRHLGFEPDDEVPVETMSTPPAAFGRGDYYRVYDVGERTAREAASQIAGAVRNVGQDAVELLGEATTPVSRIAVGTGAITPFRHLFDAYDPDMVVCSDDGFTYWRDGHVAVDAGVPVVVVNHATSEVKSVELLAEHLDGAFPDVPVYHVEQGCMFELVRG